LEEHIHTTSSGMIQNASSCLLRNLSQPCSWLQFLIKKNKESYFVVSDSPGICDEQNLLASPEQQYHEDITDSK
jgi:hypothetical protein